MRGTVAAEDRITGYQQAMDRAGLSTDGLMVDGDFNAPSGVTGAGVLLERHCDAIFCANDATAMGALEAIRAQGLGVPDDVALAGFDDLDFAARLDPPLTTVRQGVREQGAEAARTLFQLMADRDGTPRRVILPTELVIRQSTVGGVTRP
jgi:LacI family repressor for deo operon, udp, cdd, tsx, nupC, and nupG